MTSTRVVRSRTTRTPVLWLCDRSNAILPRLLCSYRPYTTHISHISFVRLPDRVQAPGGGSHFSVTQKKYYYFLAVFFKKRCGIFGKRIYKQCLCINASHCNSLFCGSDATGSASKALASEETCSVQSGPGQGAISLLLVVPAYYNEC